MELQLDLDFSPEQVNLLDMHSLLNILTVVQHQLLHMSDCTRNPGKLFEMADGMAAAAAALPQAEAAERLLAQLDDLIQAVQSSLIQIAETDLIPKEAATWQEAQANLTGIFEILKLRARELRQRRESPLGWRAHSAASLRKNFGQVFAAIERNSHGAYRIVDNMADLDQEDYLVMFEIKANEKGELLMPPVFQDVMRDLLANARKYTPPGGTILGGVCVRNNELRFVVEDSGCGIPPEEIESVVRFGYRASNVQHRPTKGGGFGLTKAYYVTKAHGGRMWISSPVANGHGTRIELRLPVPPELRRLNAETANLAALA